MEFIHDLFEYFSEQSVEYRIAFDAFVLLVVTVIPCFGLILFCDISDFVKKLISKNKNEGTMTNETANDAKSTTKNIDNMIKRRDEFISFLAFDDTCEIIIKLSNAFLVILTVFFLIVAFGIAIFTDFNRFDLIWDIFKVFAGISLFTFTGMFITHIARIGREIVYEIRKYEIEKENYNENNG